MNSNQNDIVAFTPEQVAAMLQLSKNTVYDLIGKGEIVARRVGRVYRIPKASISFIFTGLDADLTEAERVDRKNLVRVQSEISRARKRL